MTITIDGTMTTEEDAEMFNKLSIWCHKNTAKLEGNQDGPKIHIVINGPPEVLVNLQAYLLGKQYDF